MTDAPLYSRAVQPINVGELRFAVSLAIAVLEGRAGSSPDDREDALDTALARVADAFEHLPAPHRSALRWRMSFVLASVLKDPRSERFVLEQGAPPIAESLLAAIAETPMEYGTDLPIDAVFARAHAGEARGA